MSIEQSRKLISDIAATREAEDYINGLLKDPEMRADMERAEAEEVQQESAASVWDRFTKDMGMLQHPAEPEKEIER